MTTIDVRDLPAPLAEMLRQLRAKGETVSVADEGEIIARFVPMSRPYQSPEELEVIWDEIRVIAERISAAWPEGVSGAQAISEDRREL